MADVCHLGKSGEPGGRAFLLVIPFVFVSEKLALINDRDTGRPRGFGFVEMSNADATRAAGALNGTDFGGRALRVSEAQERARASTDAGGPRR
ncbi:MAG: hypothetical protein E6K51_09710 [Gammaproteobacteria bacterium]|nr:MAG: hypothetical protein E6K51_09710 [Gammaproteobacteria bacterium]